MWIYCYPDRFPGLIGFREHMPVNAGTLMRGAAGAVQGNVILAPEAMTDCDGQPTAVLQITPKPELVLT